MNNKGDRSPINIPEYIKYMNSLSSNLRKQPSGSSENELMNGKMRKAVIYAITISQSQYMSK